MPRLETVSPGTGGYTRRRAGRGFTYWGANGRRITREDTLGRIRALAIPPAWNQVWIAAEENSHIQATGVDDAGRTQYLYHPQWRADRDAEKFEKSISFGQTLPSLRRRVTRDLRSGAQDHDGGAAPHPAGTGRGTGRAGTGTAPAEATGRRRALAAAVRLMDRGALRVGGKEHSGQLEAFGATTLQRRHVEVQGEEVRLVFRGKSGSEWDLSLRDADLAEFFAGVPLAPRTAPAVCYPVRTGRRKEWRGVSAEAVNEYLTEIAGLEFTAKDFRTWQGTMAAARSLARSHRAGATSPEAVRIAVRASAELLHNTPTVARESYIDPRVLDLFEKGRVMDLRRQPDRALLALLTGGDGD
ncbi:MULTISPECIES: DNA topoisomerase IB [Citricoccus]|uniref:DNA topoisomerase IB n=1 Tax=Citricoccus TaxID=169133 RepID=UPI000255E095|nr:DNA topoisomerase IB [Citricoccus sp. CH26A]